MTDELNKTNEEEIFENAEGENEMNENDIKANDNVKEYELMEALLRAGAAMRREKHEGHGCHGGRPVHGYHGSCGPRGHRPMHAPVYGAYPYGRMMYGPACYGYRPYGRPMMAPAAPAMRGFGPGMPGAGFAPAMPGFSGPCGPRPMHGPKAWPREGFRPEGRPEGHRPEGCQGKEAAHREHKGYGRILCKLNPGEAISQKELAERLGIRPQSVSEALYVLAERGLIERSVCPEDRRVMLISLSEEGIAKKEKMLAHRENRAGRLFACLTDEEKAELFRLLKKISDAEAARG